MNLGFGGISIPDFWKQRMQDSLSASEGHVVKQKTVDTWRESAKLLEYYPETHKARVLVQRAGAAGRGIIVHIAENFIGAISGAGAAHAPDAEKQPMVDIEFMGGSATGLYNQGTVVGYRYPSADHKPPKNAHRMKSGRGVTMTHDNGKELTDSVHHDGKIHSKTLKAKKNTDGHSNEMHTVTGSNKPRSEELTEEFSGGVDKAASMLE